MVVLEAGAPPSLPFQTGISQVHLQPRLSLSLLSPWNPTLVEPAVWLASSLKCPIAAHPKSHADGSVPSPQPAYSLLVFAISVNSSQHATSTSSWLCLQDVPRAQQHPRRLFCHRSVQPTSLSRILAESHCLPASASASALPGDENRCSRSKPSRRTQIR